MSDLTTNLICPECGKKNIRARNEEGLANLNELATRNPIAAIPCFDCNWKAWLFLGLMRSEETEQERPDA